MSDCSENWNDEKGPVQAEATQARYEYNGKSNFKASEYSCKTRGNQDSVKYRHGDYDRENRKMPGGRGGAGGGGFYGRNYDFKDEIYIRPDCVGLIIGRAGANIQRIQTDFNVNVNLVRDESKAIVSGNVMEDISGALSYIKDQMHNASLRDSNEIGGGGRRDSGNEGARRDNQDFYNSTLDRVPDDDTDQNDVIDWATLNKKAEEARARRWAKCPPLTKNFYKEDPAVAQLTPEEVKAILEQNSNTLVSRVFETTDSPSDDIPHPIWKFEQCFAAYPDLLDEIKKQGFEKPSPIQAQAWPILLKGEDMIGIAQTGTGKTLAFLLPAMIHIEYQSVPRHERGGPNVLVMAPTRELALQIEKEVNKYSFRDIKAACLYGGGSRRLQINHVERGVEIIICTPGRLNDLIQAKVIDVGTITYLVLDEADRMLDMGFEPQIRKILLDIRPDRQTVMTSATWPPGVRRLAQSYMNNPIQVCVGTLDLTATHTVHQIVQLVDEEEKYDLIKKFISEMAPDDKAIVFCGKKTRADDLSSDLTLSGQMCQCIHGSRDQADREQAISDITSGEVKILIATDVASRGLDIEDITHVINFDLPRNIEEYVHRVGRTGRAGRTGTSISYVTRNDWGLARELIVILEEAKQLVPDELRNMADRFKAMKDRRTTERSKFDGPPRGGRNFGDRTFGDRNFGDRRRNQF